MTLKHILNFFTVLACLLMLQSANAITRCQDAQGKWHYGDYATEACNQSKLTELNDRGVIVNEVDAPKTSEELAAEEQEIERQQQEELRKREEQEERERILSIYETEDDIDRQRDNKLNAVQSNIDVHNAYLNSLDNKLLRFQEKKSAVTTSGAQKRWQDKIDEVEKNKMLYSKEVEVLIEQKQAIEKQYEKEKTLYLQLKQQVTR